MIQSLLFLAATVVVITALALGVYLVAYVSSSDIRDKLKALSIIGIVLILLWGFYWLIEFIIYIINLIS